MVINSEKKPTVATFLLAYKTMVNATLYILKASDSLKPYVSLFLPMCILLSFLTPQRTSGYNGTCHFDSLITWR